MNNRGKLTEGNRRYLDLTDIKLSALREETADHGQHPYAIVICCSDSRVIPEKIFSATIGDLFVIRVAGNVLDNHQLGSVEYAAAHLGVNLIVMLGHTECGAIDSVIEGHTGGFIDYLSNTAKNTPASASGWDEFALNGCGHSKIHMQNSFSVDFRKRLW